MNRPGVAEALPFPAESFRYVLMVVTICFVDNPLKALKEAFRVVVPGGCIVVGFVDRESEIGREYESRKQTVHGHVESPPSLNKATVYSFSERRSREDGVQQSEQTRSMGDLQKVVCRAEHVSQRRE